MKHGTRPSYRLDQTPIVHKFTRPDRCALAVDGPCFARCHEQRARIRRVAKGGDLLADAAAIRKHEPRPGLGSAQLGAVERLRLPTHLVVPVVRNAQQGGASVFIEKPQTSFQRLAHQRPGVVVNVHVTDQYAAVTVRLGPQFRVGPQDWCRGRVMEPISPMPPPTKAPKCSFRGTVATSG